MIFVYVAVNGCRHFQTWADDIIFVLLAMAKAKLSKVPCEVGGKKLSVKYLPKHRKNKDD